MSLATRCTACGTVFRVVQDQLKVSDGWVRCGRCGEVFNALEGLFDLERDAPPQWPASAFAPEPGVTGTSVSGRAPLDAAAPPSVVQSVETTQASGEATAQTEAVASGSSDLEVDLFLEPAEEHTSTPGELFDALIESRPSLLGLDSAGSQPSSGAEQESSGGFADARFNTEFSTVGDTAGSDEQSTVALADAPLTGPAREEAPPTAAFLRDAERAARWQRPAMRATLALLALALMIAFLAQVTLHFHDRLVAAFPALAVPVERLCSAAGCTIGPPLQINAVRVESSGLTETANRSGYRLSLTLRNRAEHVVATPSIDLRLTDSNGQLVARRVINPSEFGANSATLAPSTDTSLQANLSVGEVRIAGYAVELFYP
jgi:predicted Zn finger-like uncharacterized protein